MHVGGAICASFIVFGALSILLYKPWRRRFDRIRGVHRQAQISRAVAETVDPDMLPSHEPTKDLEQGQAIIHNRPQRSLAQKPIDDKVGEQVIQSQ